MKEKTTTMTDAQFLSRFLHLLNKYLTNVQKVLITNDNAKRIQHR